MDLNREAAFKILLNIEKENSFSNLAIKDYLSKAEVPSEAFVRRLVYGVLEKEIQIDYYLDKLLEKGIDKLKKEALLILRLGAYQIDYMDSVPDYAAINSSVDLAKKYSRGLDKLVNGVLRNWQRKKKDIKLPEREDDIINHLSILYSIKPEIVDILIDQRGEKGCEDILSGVESSSKNRPLSLRVRKKEYIEDIEEELRSLGFEVLKGDLSERIILVKRDLRRDEIGDKLPEITETKSYLEGRVSIQSEESCWISDICDPKPGNRVLDLCAAPGGKTLAMAEMMNNEGEIIASDLYEHRLKLLEINAKRLGISIIQTLPMDAAKEESFSNPLIWRDKFHIVLVDAPCSGLGVMGKKPEIKKRVPETNVLVEVQRSILDNASKNVETEGRLIYSTCTIDKRENEEIIEAFLEDNPDFTLEFQRQLIPGIDEYDGFYVASMKRKGETHYGCGLQD